MRGKRGRERYILHIRDLVEAKSRINFAKILENDGSETGVIRFLNLPPRKNEKLIIHKNRHVVCCVVGGRGRVQIAGRKYSLGPGDICWIPPNTRHSFSSKARRMD